MDIWQVLVQFVFRVTFGMSLSMAVTPAALVTSGFYRVHLWVLMGMNTFASLVIFSDDQFAELPGGRFLFALAVSVTALSYVGGVLWLYEKKQVGSVALAMIGLLGLLAAALATNWPSDATTGYVTLGILDLLTGGFLLGVIMTAMFLGHWYLNTPSMQLVPLKRLVQLMMVAILARTVLCGVGIYLHSTSPDYERWVFWAFLSFRWISGLLGTATLGYMAWETLKIPNTQSATGILYAGVILAFLGELTSQLLSVDLLYAL